MSHRLGRKFDRHRILREKDPWVVARNAFEIALEYALLGYIEQATEIYKLCENFSSDCKSFWSPGLYFAWEATSLWPDSIPPADRTPDALSKLEVEGILWRRESNATEEGLDRLISVATEKSKRDIWGDAPVRPFDLTAAIDLALYLENREKASTILDIFAENFESTWTDLSKSRQVWKILKEKALSRAIGVNEDKLAAFRHEVFEVFEDRLNNGPRRVFGDLPMRDLVDMCNKNTLKNAVWEEMDVDADNPPTTMLRDGATNQQIATLEEQLGHELPDDFKEFLSLTNGMGPIWNGFNGVPTFLGTDAIHIFDATEQQQIWDEAAVEIRFVTTLSIKVNWPALNRVIKVNSGEGLSQFVWLVEPEVGQKLKDSFFETFVKLPPDEQEHVQKMIEYFHTGEDATSEIGWQVGIWDPTRFDFAMLASWREYLEILVGDSATPDILDEVDENGRLLHSDEIFAYQLR